MSIQEIYNLVIAAVPSLTSIIAIVAVVFRMIGSFKELKGNTDSKLKELTRQLLDLSDQLSNMFVQHKEDMEKINKLSQENAKITKELKKMNDKVDKDI